MAKEIDKLYTGIVFDSSSGDYGYVNASVSTILYIGTKGKDYNDETTHIGIHTFYETVVHENEHFVIWKNLWGALPVTSTVIANSGETDSDGDFYPDSWEQTNANLGFTVGINNRDSRLTNELVNFRGHKVTTSTAYQEGLARQAEHDIANYKKYDSQDWSKDGKQW